MRNGGQILLGCDDALRLARLAASLKQHPSPGCDVMMVTRAGELLTLARTMPPDVIVLSFRNQQAVINELARIMPQIPLVSIAGVGFPEKITWSEEQVLFSCIMERNGEATALPALIQSILRLCKQPEKRPFEPSLTGIAIEAAAQPDSLSLSRMALELDQKTDILKKIRERIAQLNSYGHEPVRNELNQILQSIKTCLSNTRVWDGLKWALGEKNPQFMSQLASKHPGLTEMDLKYCCYVKMNMSNDEIRELMGINQESVRTHKYRLKKKLSLKRDESLRTYLQSVA
jgi:DNA-binding CsgD family transcriptional regulator